MDKGIRRFIWLASYPKSGNTWMRLFLHALKTGAEQINDFEKIESTNGIASSRAIIDNYLGINSSDLPDKDVQKLRPEVYALWAQDLKEETIVKVHDATFHAGIQLFPKELTKKAIYVIRNPFDMVASYANHMNRSIEKSIFELCNGEGALAGNELKLNLQVKQYLGSWSDHYNSWRNVFHDNITVVKYEDMLGDPIPTFTKVVSALNWSYDEQAIVKAIKASSFNNLKNAEEKNGFKEQPRNGSFFRLGKSGNWRKEISMEQAQTIINRHYFTLLEMGYVNEKGEILI